MGEWTFTVTIPMWLPVAYLAAGLVVSPPLAWRGWRRLQHPGPFWREFASRLRRRPWLLAAMVVAWPLAVWEELR